MICTIDYQHKEALVEIKEITDAIIKCGGKIISYNTSFGLEIEIQEENTDKFYQKYKEFHPVKYQRVYSRGLTEKEDENIDWKKLKDNF